MTEAISATPAPVEEADIINLLAANLCLAAGFDPEERVLLNRTPQIGPKGHIVVSRTCAAWELFTQEAAVALNTFVILNK